MEIQGIQHGQLSMIPIQTSPDNTRKHEIISEFEKMMMRMILKPFENSFTESVNDASHINLGMSYFLDNLSSELGQTLNFGMEKFYK